MEATEVEVALAGQEVALQQRHSHQRLQHHQAGRRRRQEEEQRSGGATATGTGVVNGRAA